MCALWRHKKDRRDCMRQFKAAWERFAAEANLTEFLNAKVTNFISRPSYRN
jgi:hypothetical protein